jgi:hypothetical protein
MPWYMVSGLVFICLFIRYYVCHRIHNYSLRQGGLYSWVIEQRNQQGRGSGRGNGPRV